MTRQFPQSPGTAEQKSILIESRLNGGMNVDVDGADLPNFQMVLAENAEISADKIFRRPGKDILTPAKPNSDPVLLYTAFKRFDGTTIYIRFTRDKIHRRSGGVWTEITSGSPYSITNTTRIRFTTLNDRFFFSVGNAAIQEINFAANTYAALGTAGAYRYVTGFFNRLVGANLYSLSTPNPTLVAWSGDINFAVWNPAVDISAGSTPLLEAATDFADPITGLFGFAAVMLILRERSLWTATKRPVASAPFQFQASFPYAGCDTPNSASPKQNGIVWYDNRSNQVYDYTVGQAPRPIGNPVRDTIFPLVVNLDSVMGTYDTIKNRYHLLVPSDISTATYEFVYDFSTESWIQNVTQNATSISALDGGVPVLTIDELGGTIDALIGTIDSLANISISPPKIFYGMSNGDILSSNPQTTADNGVAFTTSIRSKIYAGGDTALLVRRMLFKYIPKVVGTISFYFSRNAGVTWELYETVTIAPGDLNVRKRKLVTKQIQAEEFCWRIDMETASVQLLEYMLDAIPSAQVRTN